MLGSGGLSYIQYPQVARADVISRPILIPPEACCGLAMHKQELCCPLHNLHSVVTLQSWLRWPFSMQLKHLPNLSKSFLRSFTSCTFLQSSRGWPRRQNAHLLSPPLVANNALALWGPFLWSFDPAHWAVKLLSARNSTSVNRESRKCLRVHSRYCFP